MLKVARVIPLHKKDSKLDINNYRPISNLSVFSKVYEKCLLSRLNQELPTDAEGSHQHGFRRHHSTETALLTLQSYMAESLDNSKQGIIYSIDLSAAFDLLRPDKFLEQFKDFLSEGLMFAIYDFLLNRTFKVNLGEVSSDGMTLDRGCVQGSILGPKLFSLYMTKLKKVIETDEIRLVSYADDTYVVITPKEIQDVSIIAEATLLKHINFLKSLGMVVNETKTEIMWLGPSPLIDHVKIGQNLIKLSSKIKALGIYLDGMLTWDAQAEHAVAKSKKLVSTFRFLRKYLSEKQFLKAASANYYGSVFYASSVWFQASKQAFKTKLNSMHFRMLRTAKRDYKLVLKRHELTRICERATPDEWSKFITSSRVIKTLRDAQPTILYQKLLSTYFEERRKPKVGFFFDSSKSKKGRQSLQNRLLFMRSLNFPWKDLPLSDDLIRIQMKRTFFSYCDNPPTVDTNTQLLNNPDFDSDKLTSDTIAANCTQYQSHTI